MSRERIIKALNGLGLTSTDAKVYVHLATKGPQKIENIGDALKLKESLIYQSIVSLQLKGLVNLVASTASLFFALPFDKALDLLVKAHIKEAENIEQDKNEILSRWRSITDHSRE